ncbi:MAG TPA: type I DNA topoisomerase [Candidatus Paceibacterota bacterium]
MKLVIVESPSKAKTIEKYLGKEYKVRASVGHVRDLPKSNKKAIDIEGGFIPHYEISKGKEKIVSELKSEVKKADEVLLATDPDREGEAIAWHLTQALGLDAKKAKRVVFNEITERAVNEGIKTPRPIDEHLKEAQEARRVLDRLVGYDLSGLIWKKVRYGLSAGRVQSPALRILMEREREIRAFIPEDFWVIKANLETKTKSQIEFTCAEEPKTEKDANRIVDLAKRGQWQIGDVHESEATRSPRPPFTTSTLQQAASSRLGLSPANTMRLAQKLYEAGHITYMRTDSTNLAKEAVGEIAGVVKSKYGEKLSVPRVFKTKSKNAQEAHEAIRPTNFSKSEAGNSDAEKKLYRLIWSRTVASQMADAKIMRTKITAEVVSVDVPKFAANGSRTIFDGWLLADPRAKGEDVELPKVTLGESLKLLSIESEGKQTEPPNRYTEAGLVKELEKRGIGRPSTYASIIKTIIDRGYVTKEGRALTPTDTGDVVSSFLEQNFANVISDTFTAGMEEELDEIARGERGYEKTLRDFYVPFSKEIERKDKEIGKITNLGEAPKETKCPTCNGPMIIKLGKSGKFYSCTKFPECSGARTLAGEEMKGPESTGRVCPKCGENDEGVLVIRHGKYGEFISCSRYPKCKYIEEDEAVKKARDTGVECPTCKKGTMGERRGRFGIFYGCSNYPDCKNIIKTKPTGKVCSECGSLMMEGTKTIPERCSNRTCPNHNPHKLKARSL